ncbi:MAG: glycosyltransferase [Phycisphaera sp.]|nr:glycosyltransferase [Phycisphaera sp.]
MAERTAGKSVLFFTHYFPPESNAPASRVYEITKRWVREGWKVTVITCAPNAPAGKLFEGYRNRLCHRETLEGIDVIRVWTYLAPNKGTVRRILNYVSYMVAASLRGLFVKRPDIVIATSPQFFCGWAGVIVSKLRRLRFVLEIRDIWPESIVTVGAMRKGRLIRFLEWLELKMYAAADHVVTVGDGYRKVLIGKGVAEQDITVISNGVDRELFSEVPADVSLIEKHNLQGKFVCSYIGTIGMACGLEVALRASKLLADRGRNDIVFLLVGDGAHREALENQTREQQLTDRVIFTGRQDKSLMPAYLALSGAALVHLHKTDLFATVMPSKIFESAAMARPIILGVTGFAADFIRTAGAGICIEPENAEQLADAVVKLADDPQLARRYGEQGQAYVFKHFDRDRLSADYLELLERLTALP